MSGVSRDHLHANQRECRYHRAAQNQRHTFSGKRDVGMTPQAVTMPVAMIMSVSMIVGLPFRPVRVVVHSPILTGVNPPQQHRFTNAPEPSRSNSLSFSHPPQRTFRPKLN